MINLFCAAENKEQWYNKIVDDVFDKFTLGRAVLVLLDHDSELLDLDRHIRGRREELQAKLDGYPFHSTDLKAKLSIWPDLALLKDESDSTLRTNAIFNAIQVGQITLVSRSFGRGTGQFVMVT